MSWIKAIVRENATGELKQDCEEMLTRTPAAPEWQMFLA
jgi:hypothetical protein